MIKAQVFAWVREAYQFSNIGSLESTVVANDIEMFQDEG